MLGRFSTFMQCSSKLSMSVATFHRRAKRGRREVPFKLNKGEYFNFVINKPNQQFCYDLSLTWRLDTVHISCNNDVIAFAFLHKHIDTIFG